MLKKVIIALLLIALIMQLSTAFLKLFDWGVEIDHKEIKWVKVVAVETVKKEIRTKVASYTKTIWNTTVDFGQNKKSIVYVNSYPEPKIGQCLPVFASYLSNGNIIATLNTEKWQFSADGGSC